MARPLRDRIVEALLERHGKTYAAELGIDLERSTPSALYRWLCAATLLSSRINTGTAMQAARALAEQGWTTELARQRRVRRPARNARRTIRCRLRLFALDQPLEPSPGLDRETFRAAASGHVLEQADLIVTYERGP